MVSDEVAVQSRVRRKESKLSTGYQCVEVSDDGHVIRLRHPLCNKIPPLCHCMVPKSLHFASDIMSSA